MNVKKFGRSYSLGKSLDTDLRNLIIDECLKSGGHAAFGYLPVTYVSIASRFNVSANTVSKLWKKFCNERRYIDPSPKGGDHSSKLSEGDLELLEILKKPHGTIQLNELYSILEEFGDCRGVSFSAISRAIKSRLLSGERYTRKRVTNIAFEHFTDENMMYTQLFINYLSSKDLRKIKILILSNFVSPDLNPVELCFNKIKTELNGQYSPKVHRNLKLAVAEAVERLSAIDTTVLPSYGLSFSCLWVTFDLY